MPLAAEDLPVLSGRSPSGPDEPRTLRPARLELSDAQFRALGALQEDLPMIEEPFSPLAERAGLSPGELLSLAEGSLRSGWMRRYSALVDHRALGASANVLVAWRADAERADAAGAACAGLPAVSHCYLRPAADDWPYNLYTMIHGRDRAECLDAIGQIAQATGLAERAELWTLKEYKRRRARLLTDLEVCWEARSGPAGGL